MNFLSSLIHQSFVLDIQHTPEGPCVPIDQSAAERDQSEGQKQSNRSSSDGSNLNNHYPTGPDASHSQTQTSSVSDSPDRAPFLKYLWHSCCVTLQQSTDEYSEGRYADDGQEEECARWLCRYSKSRSLADNPIKQAGIIILFAASSSHFVVRRSIITPSTGSYWCFDHCRTVVEGKYVHTG